MKRNLGFFVFLQVVLCLLSFYGTAKQVDANTASIIAKNFYYQNVCRTKGLSCQDLNPTLIYQCKSYTVNTDTKTDFPVYYIFNLNQNTGFVIVAADDIVIPVLGYSNEGAYDPNHIQPSFIKWMEGYKTQILYAKAHNLSQTNEILIQWNNLIANKTKSVTRGTNSVSQLLSTKWDQSPYYNALCPYDYTYSERTITGCVATAMAQIMKFYNYPAQGIGYHYFNHSRYGTLSANFGATTYNWGGMPNSLTSSNSAIATIMYHCGVSVDMNYNVGSQGGSSAYPSVLPNSYINYFGYESSVSFETKSNYTDASWISLMKAELDASRPIQYAGYGNAGGHSFVMDGYDNSNYFHFNWGWGGYADGYFAINALNPSTYSFSSNQNAVIGIKPPPGSGASYDLRLYSSISVNPDPINFNSGFSVSVMLANYGTSSANNFSGDFCAAIFNSSNQFVSYIETKTSYNLNYNSYFSNPVVFTTTAIAALTPGYYTIGIYYKPTGASLWTAFSDGSYQNFTSIEVQGNNVNTMKLYANITTNPIIITRNQTFTVSFDVINEGSSTFYGDISVDINKSDGAYLRELSKKTGLSLPSYYHYSGGLTYTITGGLDEEPGTYQLFVWDKPDLGSWEIMGSGLYSNPIIIQVVEPNLKPDAYEVNNYASQAYNLPLSFSGNYTSTTTLGSNCHVGSDIDYYKIDLPSGYNYTIMARLNDSYNSADTNTYTLDARFSYSTDSLLWSDSYDDVMPSNLLVNNGGTLFFHVSPFFAGKMGTYLLDIEINRVAIIPELNPDIYEVNNSIGQAYPLPFTFIGNSTETSTVGSNCHLVSDIDYYKVNLEPGYDYTVISRLHDSYNSGNGNTYTLNAQFSYSTDGSSWSANYDDVMPSNILVNNGGTIYFFVTPYIAGKMGTYLLDIQITRNAKLPDLIVYDYGVSPLILLKGQTISATCTVKNQGFGQAASSTLEYYLSNDNTWNIDDLPLGTSTVYSLNPDVTVDLNKNLVIPYSTNYGDWYIIFKVDAKDEINEEDENNNQSYVMISLPSGSDISENNSVNLFKIYPNPASDYAQIELFDNQFNFKSIQVANSLGQVLIKQNVQNQKSIRLEVSNFTKGIYYIETIANDKKYYSKLIINR